MQFSEGQKMAEYLMSAKSDEIRGVTFSVPNDDSPIPPLYPHQTEALERLRARDRSTILHLPTGSGKTRIALEFIAETLKRAPQTTIIWGSYPTTLIRQAMVRVAQFSPKLPEGLRFTWAKSGRKNRSQPSLFADNDLIFVLRGTLADMLADVGERPKTSGLRSLLASKDPLVVIYDECHQLGARRLQRGWRVVARKSPPGASWPRILGLSATPLPRNSRRRTLMWKTLFPLAPGASDSPGYPWRMDVAYRVQNASLETLGVLCPVNAYQQNSGFFDIPTEVLKRATRRRPIKEPNAVDATLDDLLHFAAQFPRGSHRDSARSATKDVGVYANDSGCERAGGPPARAPKDRRSSFCGPHPPQRAASRRRGASSCLRGDRTLRSDGRQAMRDDQRKHAHDRI